MKWLLLIALVVLCCESKGEEFSNLGFEEARITGDTVAVEEGSDPVI
jgi:hypothetical protein